MDIDLSQFSSRLGINLTAEEMKNLAAFLETQALVYIADNYFTSRYPIINADILDDNRQVLCNMTDKKFSNCRFVGDFTEAKIEGFHFVDVCFDAESKLPEDEFFFRNNSFKRVTFPPFDFDNYRFLKSRTIKFERCIFADGTKYPENFGKHKGTRLHFENCHFGNFDFAWLDGAAKFGLMSFANARFPERSNIPDMKNFIKDLAKKHAKRIVRPYLPSIDYSDCDFYGASVAMLRFGKDAKLPLHKDFFQDLVDKKCPLALPEADYSICDFTDVDITKASFPKDAKIPTNPNLFQGIHDKTLKGVDLPSGDYRNYDFTDVCLKDVKFTNDSILPIDLFEQIDMNTSTLMGIVWPLQFVEDVLLVKMPDKNISLKHSTYPDEINILLHAKYKNNKKVTLKPLNVRNSANAASST